jgi:hypothetical protein
MHMSYIGILVDGIKLRMKDFLIVSVIHVKRQLNEVAHILAKIWFSSLSSEVLYSVPSVSGKRFVLMLFDQQSVVFCVKCSNITMEGVSN